MKDETIVRIISESCDVLAHMKFPVECHYVQHSYSALLKAAKANHPNDAFISALPVLETEKDDINPQEMYILFTQLRIALESLRDEGAAREPSPVG